MTFRFSARARTIRVYNLRADTREFIGAGDAYLPPHTGLPADCTNIAPLDVLPGNVAIFDGEAWQQVEDHRGKTVFDTATGEQIFITAPGPLPSGVTPLVPEGLHMAWDGKGWVKDAEAERQAGIVFAQEEKVRLTGVATLAIDTLEDAVGLDMATDEEKALLLEWKKYRVLISRIEPADAPDFDWPPLPVV
ncbi:tail fiber assembly protein [Scandinavium goeteborgense]|uniref:tail fiber assembly protein n=1 Tax=Scandinavium goeteborgense TaxID=1851514 RepID=UPI00382DE922